MVFSNFLLLKEIYPQEDLNTLIIAKELVGEVSFINQQFISVIYSKNKEEGKEEELVLYLDRGVKLENISGLGDIKTEDIVKIDYAEIKKEGKVKRVAKKIRLVKPKGPSLNLKGFKK